MSDTTPTTQQLLDAIKAACDDAGQEGEVLTYWPAALVRLGQSLNFGRTEDDGPVKALCFSLYRQKHERLGGVPLEPAKAQGQPYTRLCTWTFRWKYVRSYFEGAVESGEHAGKRSEQLFDEELAAYIDALGLSPKLGPDVRVDGHTEAQVDSRTLPSYGTELAHTADGTLTVSLRQLVKP